MSELILSLSPPIALITNRSEIHPHMKGSLQFYDNTAVAHSHCDSVSYYCVHYTILAELRCWYLHYNPGTQGAVTRYITRLNMFLCHHLKTQHHDVYSVPMYAFCYFSW